MELETLVGFWFSHFDNQLKIWPDFWDSSVIEFSICYWFFSRNYIWLWPQVILVSLGGRILDFKIWRGVSHFDGCKILMQPFKYLMSSFKHLMSMCQYLTFGINFHVYYQNFAIKNDHFDSKSQFLTSSVKKIDMMPCVKYLMQYVKHLTVCMKNWLLKSNFDVTMCPTNNSQWLLSMSNEGYTFLSFGIFGRMAMVSMAWAIGSNSGSSS